ncbi:(Fe-S)-binding protein [Desulfoscipio sp. XC116]|uniref:(Fe-S)-binding protein n=1 Tax=Desulfoscipio sp. XC116 TaxID=3144975 RepID=UPI00325C18B8
MLDYEGYAERLEEEISKSTFRCRNCNYCYSRCPLYNSMEGFMVNGPSGIIQSIYYYLKWDLEGEETNKDIVDILFSCTTCNSCVMACEELSAGIPLLEIIENGRKLLVDKNLAPMPYQRNALKAIYRNGNPYNFNPEDRLNWVGDLKIKRIPEQSSKVLYYVGCSTSYDPDMHNVAKSLVKILSSARIDFGILENETCCGCAANRLGDEFLFDEISQKNAQNFLQCGAKKLVAASPHCYNTFINEYRGLENIEVLHYTQFLHKLATQNSIKFQKSLNYVVTYHDPCYLGKHNGIYEEPRELISAIPGVKLAEMKENRKMSLCCGGGGGRMWAEIKEEKRLANIRVEQALATGADVLAVACPWCHTMLLNAVKDMGQEENLKVMDIAELFSEALEI